MANSVNVGNAALLQMGVDAGYQPAKFPSLTNDMEPGTLVSDLKAREARGNEPTPIAQNASKPDKGQAPGRG